MIIRTVTQERLKELVSYNPATGEFVWNRRKKGRQRGKVGAKLGRLGPYGYWQLTLDHKEYKAHRLAWLYVYGKWPDNQIDHINGDRLDNRIANLRDATHAQNLHNSKRSKANTSGAKYVYWDKRREKWLVQICHNNKQHHIGFYADFNEAKQVAIESAIKYHGEFARLE